MAWIENSTNVLIPIFCSCFAFILTWIFYIHTMSMRKFLHAFQFNNLIFSYSLFWQICSHLSYMNGKNLLKFSSISHNFLLVWISIIWFFLLLYCFMWLISLKNGQNVYHIYGLKPLWGITSIHVTSKRSFCLFSVIPHCSCFP